MRIVIQDQANDETSDPISVTSLGVTEGEAWTVCVGGTFSSATAKVEVAPEAAGPWSSPEELSFTETGYGVGDITPSNWIRFDTSGGDGSTEVSLWVGTAN